MEIQTLPYSEARELIQDGDVLSFKPKKHEFCKRITCWVTNTQYYHTAFAVWLSPKVGEKRLFAIEAHAGGRRLVPMSIYDNSIFDVTVCPIKFSKVEAEVIERVAKVPYGYLDFIIIGLREMFGFPRSGADGEVCSEFVAVTLNAGGFKIEDTEISPGKLDALLMSRGVERRVLVRPK